MTDYLKARFYAYRYSRNLIVMLISMGLWTLGTILNVFVFDGNGYRISLYYGVWTFVEFYLCFIPALVSTWYANTTINGYDGNIPYQTKDRRFHYSAVLFVFVMNTILVISSLVLGIIIYSIPNCMVEYTNDPFTMFKLIVVLFFSSYCRCAFVIFATEITGSRIWGSVLGMLVSCGFLSGVVIGIEVTFCVIFGIRETTLPLSSTTSFYMINNIIPSSQGGEHHLIVSDFPGNIWFMMLGMIAYIALFVGITTAVNKRKDVLR